MPSANPFQISIEVEPTAPPRAWLKLSLTPEGLLLRSRFRALLLHCPVVEEPAWFDLGRDMDLIQRVPCLAAPPPRLSLTCYGVGADGGLRLVFRNWGNPEKDGLPA